MIGRLVKINPKRPQQKKIEEAAEIIRKGGVVIFPTDTVYGIGAGIFNKKAITRIYKIKGRDRKKSLVLFINSKKDLDKFTERIPEKGYRFIKEFWPGPLTLIFKASKKIPFGLKDKRGTIGVRIPGHAVARGLVGAAGPLATTSANVSGCKSARKIKDISKKLFAAVDVVIDGGSTPVGKESTVLDLTQKPFKVLREGAVRIKYSSSFVVHSAS